MADIKKTDSFIEAHDPPYTVITPISVMFPETHGMENGACIMMGGNTFMINPIDSDYKKHPVRFIHEILIRTSSEEVFMLLRETYEKKSTIMVGQTAVSWGEYEKVFSECQFYTDSKKAKVLKIQGGA